MGGRAHSTLGTLDPPPPFGDDVDEGDAVDGGDGGDSDVDDAVDDDVDGG